MIINSRYKIISALGAGISEVFLAEDFRSQNKKVALKIISSKIADDPKVATLRNEFNILRALNHPNIVTVFELQKIYEAEDESLIGSYFLVSEYVEGKNLFDFFNRDYSEEYLDELCTILVQVCEALYYIHQAGLIHYDIRPENILISYKNNSIQVKLIDFGFSTFSIYERRGTIGYIAPEILLGKDATFKSDLYSLGATLFYVLERKLPPIQEDIIKAIEDYIERDPPEIKEIFPDYLRYIIRKLMAKKPEDRFRNSLEIIDNLPEKYQTKQSIWFFPKFIYQREEEFDKIKKFIHDVVSEKSTLLIVGEKGSGKTFLINESLLSLEEKDRTYFRIRSAESVLGRQNFISSILDQIKEVGRLKTNFKSESLEANIKTLEKILLEKNLDEQREYIQNYLTKILIDLANKETFMVVIDDFDELDEISRSYFFHILPTLSSYNRKFILTISSNYVKEFEKKHFSSFDYIILTPLSKNQIKNYLKKSFNFDFPYEEVTDLIIEFTDCYPLSINEFINYLILDELLICDSSGFRLVKSKLNDQRLLEFSSKLNEVRLSKINSRALSILKFLSCSNTPLSVDELNVLTGCDELEIKEELLFLSSLGYLNYSGKNEQAEIAVPAFRNYLIDHLANKETIYLQLARLFEDKSVSPFIIADLYEKAGLKEKAFSYYKMAVHEADKYYSFAQMEKSLKRAINLTDDIHELKNLKILLAKCYYKLSEYEKYIELANEVLKNYDLTNDEKYDLNLILASAHHKKGNIEDAYNYFDLAYKFAETVEQKVNVDLQQIKVESVLGNYNIVRKKCENLLDEYGDVIDSKTRAEIYNNLGIVNSLAGLYSQAISYFEKTKKIYESLSENYSLPQIYLNLGNIYHILGEREKAREYWNIALELSEAFGNLSKKGLILNNLGISYLEVLEYETALEYYTKAKIIFEKIHDNYGYSLTLFNLSETNFFLCNYCEALDYVNESIKISRNNLDIDGLIQGLFLKGYLLYELFQIKELEELLIEILNIIEENKIQATHLQYFLYLTGIISLYQKNYEDSDIKLSLAQELFGHSDKKFWYSRSTLDLMWLKLYKGEFEIVLNLFNELNNLEYSELNKLIKAEAYLILGEMARRPGSDLENQAIFYFDKAIALASESYIGEPTWQVLFTASEEYLRKGAIKKGMTLYSQAKSIFNFIFSKISVMDYRNSYLAHVKRRSFLSKLNKLENLF